MAYEREQILIAPVQQVAAVCGMPEKKEPEKINVRLDKEATALVRAAKKKSRRSLNNEASTALVEHYTSKSKCAG